MLETTPLGQGLAVEAPAKVNLTLRVLGARSDGYHDLESVVAAVSLFDTLEFQPARDVRLACEGTPVPNGADNLVLRAARRLAEECGCRAGAHIRLAKRIPPGRGFGGGSSDAAAALAGLNALWDCGLGRKELSCLAASIGSDVPLFLGPPVSVMRGRGEFVEPVAAPAPWRLVLAWPDFGLSTAEVYAAYDRLGPSRLASPAATEILGRLAGPVREAREFIVNDLEPAADVVRGGRTDVRAILEGAGAAAVGMTGSGSAYFALADTESEARRLAQATRAAGAAAYVATIVVDVPEQKEVPR